MAYVYQIVVLDPRTTLLIKCRAIYMATLTGSRNMHHWTFTLNLNFATGMWKQTFHDDLECHKLMFVKNKCPTCSEHPCSDVERTWSGTSQKGTGVLKMKGVSQKLQFLRSNASDVSACFRFRNSVQFTLLHLSAHVLKCIWYIYMCVCGIFSGNIKQEPFLSYSWLQRH